MPTKRPRLTVTETPAMARRLSLAASAFPESAGSRHELLLRLTEVAERVLAEALADDGERAAAKRRLFDRTRAITPEQASAMIEAREAEWSHEPYAW